MVADLVAFTIDPLHEADVVFGLLADHEEGAVDVVLLEDVEDLRRPVGIGAVVEGERDLFGVVAVLRDGVGERVGVHRLVDDERFCEGMVLSSSIVTVRWPFCGRPVTRRMSPSPSVSTSYPGAMSARALTGSSLSGCVPDVPDGVVFGAETPESEGLEAEGAGGAHLVEHGDGVEKPDLMADVSVFVDVREVRIERVVVEIDLGVGVGGRLPGLLVVM